MAQLEPSSMKFFTDSNPPDFSKMPVDEILGTAAILVSVFYEGQEFFRVGYYVVNEY
jgi:histone chaperone ASF1